MQDKHSAFLQLLEKLPAGAYLCDSEGLITYFNRAASEIWGRAPELLHPEERFCGSLRLYGAGGEPIPHNACWLALALRDQTDYSGKEIVIEREDGERRDVLAHASPLFDDDGMLTGALNILVDITDRKQAERALKEADLRKDEFLATLAHELRNPLSALYGCLALIQLRESTDGQDEVVETMHRQLGVVTRLVEDLLDVSRVSLGRLTLQVAAVSVDRVLKTAIEATASSYRAKGHTLDYQAPSGALFIEGDETRLVQIFTNLLANASKFTPSGGHVSIWTENAGADVLVRVQDSGVGIPEDMIETIFETYRQGTTEEATLGIGIGLSLAQRLAVLHGGFIEASSLGRGRGSTFTVTLPRGDAPFLSEVAAVDVETEVSRKRILLVEDNDDSRYIMQILLSNNGYDVRAVKDGPRGIALLGEFNPGVVLLDIGLPGINGYEVATQIRRTPGFQDVRIIAHSGWAKEDSDELSVDGRKMFDAHLMKPASADTLVKTIEGASPESR